MTKLRWVLRNAEEIVCSVILIQIVVTVTVAIVSRMFHLSIVWTDEFARYSFIWFVYLGSVVAWKRKGHIVLDLVFKLLPKSASHILQFFIQLFLVILFAIVFYYGAKFTALTWETPTTSLQWPAGLVYLSVPVSMGLLIIYTIKDMIKNMFL